jgi:hypothetical protein
MISTEFGSRVAGRDKETLLFVMRTTWCTFIPGR